MCEGGAFLGWAIHRRLRDDSSTLVSDESWGDKPTIGRCRLDVLRRGRRVLPKR